MPDLLPNSLGRLPRQDYFIPFPGRWFVMFCANCGVDGPRCRDTELPAQYAFYLCNDCADKYGEVAGCTATPDDVFMSKVSTAMIEEYGHPLTEREIIIELGDPNSVITKLENEGRRRR
jgi:hypothetical protein